MMLDGACSALETWALPTFASASGCSPRTPELSAWQTPVADDAVERKAGKYNSRGEPKLSAQVINWPTPRANDAEKRGQVSQNPRNGLPGAVLWPTPTAMSKTGGQAMCKWGGSGARKRLQQMAPEEMTKSLNPTWVEWLMGWPIHWTDPSGGPSSEDFQEWLESNRTALTAFVQSATVRFHCSEPLHGDCSGGQ